MEMKKEEQKPQSRGFIVEALIMRIEALLHLIKSDVIRATISAKLGEATDVKILYQLLSLAQTSIESSELIEYKISTNDLEYNPFTGEILSEINVLPAVNAFIKIHEERPKGKTQKNNPKPPSSAI